MEPLAACLSTKRASLRGWRRSRGERFGDVEPLAARLSDLLEARGERFGDVERLAACLSTKRASLRVSRRSRGERFGDVEPLAVCLSEFADTRGERFGDVERLAACLSTKRASLRVSRRARGERFGDVEPLAAVLSGFAEARGEGRASAAIVRPVRRRSRTHVSTCKTHPIFAAATPSLLPFLFKAAMPELLSDRAAPARLRRPPGIRREPHPLDARRSAPAPRPPL